MLTCKTTAAVVAAIIAATIAFPRAGSCGSRTTGKDGSASTDAPLDQ